MVTAPLFHWLLAYGGWRQALGIITTAYALLGWLAWACLPDAQPEGQAPARHRSTPWNQDTARAARPLLANMAMLLAATPFGAASFAGLGRLLPPFGFSGTILLLLISAMAPPQFSNSENGRKRTQSPCCTRVWGGISSRPSPWTLEAMTPEP